MGKDDDGDNGRNEPCRLLCLNINGLILKEDRWRKENGNRKKINGKWKKEEIEEYVSENNIIIMNFTETWLDKDKR